jgi:ribosomal protein L44E
MKQNLPWTVDRYLTSQKFSKLTRSWSATFLLLTAGNRKVWALSSLQYHIFHNRHDNSHMQNFYRQYRKNTKGFNVQYKFLVAKGDQRMKKYIVVKEQFLFLSCIRCSNQSWWNSISLDWSCPCTTDMKPASMHIILKFIYGAHNQSISSINYICSIKWFDA